MKENKYRLGICKQRLTEAQNKIEKLFQEYYVIVNKDLTTEGIFNTDKQTQTDITKQLNYEKLQKKFRNKV